MGTGLRYTNQSSIYCSHKKILQDLLKWYPCFSKGLLVSCKISYVGSTCKCESIGRPNSSCPPISILVATFCLWCHDQDTGPKLFAANTVNASLYILFLWMSTFIFRWQILSEMVLVLVLASPSRTPISLLGLFCSSFHSGALQNI